MTAASRTFSTQTVLHIDITAFMLSADAATRPSGRLSVARLSLKNGAL